ncbi:MAG: hypothetical protein CSA65_09760 [Proteobacteria bacterium]|nr:MAG: hypothetical protein CSB49_06400 [Pseudomonadota bacterium]PIE17070.1 MAG: hypothetical protein CSA65_09760 [Pseudomonadota bacterium]
MAGCVALVVIGDGHPVAAYDFEVSARTEAYAYQLRRYDRDGLIVLNRRRITQYLGLRVYNLLDPGQHAYGPDGERAPTLLSFHGMVRFFSDFGGYSEPTEPIEDLRDNRFELLVGSLEGRNLFGFLDFSLGRQYAMELFDIVAYDGLRVRLRLPAKLFVESHGGVQVNRTRPFGLAVFEPDGTAGERDTDRAWAPTFGVAAGIDHPRRFSLRLAYRAVMSRAVAAEGELDEQPASWAMDQEILVASAQAVLPSLGTQLSASLRYNVINASFDELSAGLAQPLVPGQRAELEVLRSRPHFDGDSIFNVFALEAFHELAGRYSLRLLPGLLVEARVGYRWLWQDESERGSPGSLSLALSTLWRYRRLWTSADAFLLDGREGRRFGGDLFAGWRSPRWFFGRRLTLEGRVSLVHVEDVRPEVEALTTLGLQAGATMRFLPGVRLHVTLEENVSRLYKSALRLLTLLDLELAP